ncbi:MAG TPA: hypothetical protein VHQ41_03905 [Patescibacteria group bacterium]|nr:hypothetical protein [Patescibacteria group bacterium]
MQNPKTKVQQARIFTFSEMWTADWRCKFNDGEQRCVEPCRSVLLNVQENQQLDEALKKTDAGNPPSGPKAATYILENNLGTPLCSLHVAAEYTLLVELSAQPEDVQAMCAHVAQSRSCSLLAVWRKAKALATAENITPAEAVDLCMFSSEGWNSGAWK